MVLFGWKKPRSWVGVRVRVGGKQWHKLIVEITHSSTRLYVLLVINSVFLFLIGCYRAISVDTIISII